MKNQPSQLSVRNFALGIANGSLFILAESFLDAQTILPALALDLTGGRVVGVGLLISLVSSGWMWPQVFLSNYLQTKPRYLPYYRISALLRVATRFGLWAAIMRLGPESPTLLVALVALLLLVHSSVGGIGLIPFLSIVSDTIPATWRGKFFGARAFLGGLLGLVAGYIAQQMLSAHSSWQFPYNYGQLALYSAIATVVGVGLFSVVEERTHPVERRRLPLRLHLVRGTRLFRRNTDFRRLVRARIFFSIAHGLCVPFIVPFAVQQLGIAKAAVGMFLMARVLGSSGSNAVWSYISDRLGNRLLLLISSVAATLLPIMVALTVHIPTTELAGGAMTWRLAYLGAVFALAGLCVSGENIGQLSYLLEVTPPRARPTYLGFYWTVMLPLAWVPFISSLLIGDAGRYMLGFGLSLVMALAMVISVIKLREIRGQEGR